MPIGLSVADLRLGPAPDANLGTHQVFEPFARPGLDQRLELGRLELFDDEFVVASSTSAANRPSNYADLTARFEPLRNEPHRGRTLPDIPQLIHLQPSIPRWKLPPRLDDRLCRMAKKKPASRTKKKKKPALKQKTTVKKAGALRRTAARRKKPNRTKSRSARTLTAAIRKRSPLLTSLDSAPQPRRRGRGDGNAGQSGDLQGLRGVAAADSESVEELLEEGQAFEAGILSGVEEADADQREVRTKEVLEDDVPLEYLDKD